MFRPPLPTCSLSPKVGSFFLVCLHEVLVQPNGIPLPFVRRSQILPCHHDIQLTSIILSSLINIYYGLVFWCSSRKNRMWLWLCAILYCIKPSTGTSVLQVKYSIIWINGLTISVYVYNLSWSLWFWGINTLVLRHKRLFGVTFEEEEKAVLRQYFTKKWCFGLCLGNFMLLFNFQFSSSK